MCVGPDAIVTTRGRTRWSTGVLGALLPDGDALVRSRPSNLLVTLAERIADVYVAMHEELTAREQEMLSRRLRRERHAQIATETRFLRHLHAHREAVERLIARGRRWLDAGEMERLKAVTARLGDCGTDPRTQRDDDLTT